MDYRRWGVQTSYEDGQGVWQPASIEGLDAAVRAMRAPSLPSPRASEPPPSSEGPDLPAPLPLPFVLRQGETRPVTAPSELTLEDGTKLRVEAYLPRSIPLGYHTLRELDSEAETSVIVTPTQCHLPADLRAWGWAVQLYATRSERSWGMGDLADLRRLAQWSKEKLGAGMMLINPLHAPLPVLSQQPSPYYPSTRIYRNPLYIAIEDVPGAHEYAREWAALAAQGKALLANPRIDRDAVFRAKMPVLEALWDRLSATSAMAGFEQYCEQEGRLLESYATFCVLAEKHTGPFQAWPSAFRHPDSPAVSEFRWAHHHRVRFHQWLQWLLDEQLKAAGQSIGLVADLAVGVDPSGADAWLWQELIAQNIEVGAPPDEFNTQGQKWGLSAFLPARLQAAGYLPFIRIIRSALRHAGGVRLDHVMGLFRLFWIPRDMPAKKGVYVRYPALDLLDIVALESHRAKAFIIGEDLGTVQEEVRRELAYRRILSYRVMWFERGPTEHYPKQALSTVTTHDLPTIAGLWSGSDLATQVELGLRPNVEGTKNLRSDLAGRIGVSAQAAVEDVVVETHRALGKAPSMLVAATLDDALAMEQRPNMPGTTVEYPSWCVALPKTIEQIEASPLPTRIAEALAFGLPS